MPKPVRLRKPDAPKTRVQRARKAEEPAKPAAARGRPPKRVYINVLVKETTRVKIKQMTKRYEVSQGELLDMLFSGKLSEK